MEDEITYMQTHPPRCLGDKIAAPKDVLKDFLRGQLGYESTSFSPVCECGSQKFIVSRPIESGITGITCCNCGITRTLFDPTKHGYDGELGHNADLKLGDNEEYACSKCGNTTCDVAIAFQYSGETDILQEDNPPEINPEDLFGWFMVAAQCNRCGGVEEVAQAECT